MNEIIANMEMELDDLRAELADKSGSKVLEHAYEIVTKQALIDFFYAHTEFLESYLAELKKLKNPLEFFYSEWLGYDGGLQDALGSFVTNTVESL